MKELLPPAMIAAALLVSATGLLDRWGLEGASRGLAMGAVVCAPLWLLSIYRRSRERREEEKD